MGRPRLTSKDHLLTTAIAIDDDKGSHSAVKWAVDNLLNKKHQCIIVHVRSQAISGPLDASIPKGGRPPTETEMHQLFLPYRGFCARKGVEAKEVVLHDIEVSSALLEYITNNFICNIVVGASNRNAFTRNFKKLDVATVLTSAAPEFCSVYVISKGKVQSCRSSSQPCTPMATAVTPRMPPKIRLAPNFPPESPVSEDVSRTSSSESWRSASSDVKSDRSNDSFQNTPSWGKYSGGKTHSPLRSIENMDTSPHMPCVLSNLNYLSGSGDYSGPFSFLSTDMSSYDTLDFSYASGSSKNSSLASLTPSDLDAEMKKLRLELKQNMDMYHAACKDTYSFDQRGRELQVKHAEEAAFYKAETEKQRAKHMMEASQLAQHLAKLDVQKGKDLEMKAKFEEEERRRKVEVLADGNPQFRRYILEEIEIATEYFSNSLKIGEGGYGPVYRGTLDGMVVAIKVLRPDLSQGQSQFQQEVDVLSGMRHPNMVLLVGACPEYGCLVYEYMENGSLEDQLFQKDNSPPMPWRDRFRISAEIAAALLFLHQTKPEPVVHRDLKPGNILLDSNYISKIGDVGLARLVPASMADSVTQYHMTAAAGTFCYIDPEYQQTGMLGVKSDLYSLGVMFLQIITARPPMGLTHKVERAIERGKIVDVLDPAVTDWPIEAALAFAKMALMCCELRKKDRPDLGSYVVPELNRLRDFGMYDEYTRSNYRHNLYPRIDSSQYRSIPKQSGSSSSSSSL